VTLLITHGLLKVQQNLIVL